MLFFKKRCVIRGSIYTTCSTMPGSMIDGSLFEIEKKMSQIKIVAGT